VVANRNVRLLRGLFLAGWLVVSTLAASSLTAWHWISLPVPPQAASPEEIAAGGQWRVTHYLSSDCACSRSVADYLVKRGPLPQALEDVVLIRTSALAEDARLEGTLRHAKGNQKAFRIKSVTPEEAARHGIEAVPLLEIAAPGNRVLYRGGHQRRGERPGIYSDIAIVSALMAQDAPQRLPVYGCATSSRLRGLIDPFHIKSLSFYFFGRS
jgi:hypothetical protein